MPAPLIPEVALVELPPMNLHKESVKTRCKACTGDLRLLVKQEHVSTALEESVCGREASETTTDDNNLGHFACVEGGGGEYEETREEEAGNTLYNTR